MYHQLILSQDFKGLGQGTWKDFQYLRVCNVNRMKPMNRVKTITWCRTLMKVNLNYLRTELGLLRFFISKNYLAIDTYIIRNWWKNFLYVYNDSQVKKTQFEVIFLSKFVPELNNLFLNRSLTMYFSIYFLVKLIYYTKMRIIILMHHAML